ncbi:MAG: YrzE family protein [Candidatus Hydrogenedentes bacterium]|nr:YrzE family protein [Candidatus Hydrogenedentota bacterium]
MSTETSRGEQALRALRPVRVFHPMLLALTPLWGNYAYGENAGLLPISALARPAAVLLAMAVGLWIFFTVLRKDRHHGGLLASAVIVPLLVVWGALEEAIRSVIPLLSNMQRGTFYLLIVAVAIMLIGAIAYGKRGDRQALRHVLILGLVIFGISMVVATFLLAPVFGRRAAWLITGYCVATLLGVRAVWNYHGDYKVATRSLNWFATILLVLYACVLLVNGPRQPEVTAATLPIAQQSPVPKEELPDIYLIALDGYARSDMLRSAYAYNNMSFEQEMKGLGFRVAGRSIANYPQAVLSLTAMLNAKYLDELLKEPGDGDMPSMTSVFAHYHENSVFDTLRSVGYRIESFSPGLESLEPRRDDVVRLEPPRALGEFEMVLMDRTFASRMMQAVYYVRYKNPAYWRYAFRRDRIIYAFEEMGRLAKEQSDTPRLIFANLLIPEPPYLFTRDGGRAQPYGPGSLGGDRTFRGLESEYREAFLGQVYFTNQKLIETAKRIIEGSKRPALIIVVSGRGAPPALERQPGSADERFMNLLMVRFPEGADADVPQWRDSLSLVNVFRVVLNQIANAQLELLEDKTVLPPESKPSNTQPTTSLPAK